MIGTSGSVADSSPPMFGCVDHRLGRDQRGAVPGSSLSAKTVPGIASMPVSERMLECRGDTCPQSVSTSAPSSQGRWVDAMERLKQLTPMLQTKDVRMTIEFYTELLGFQVTGSWPEANPVWCMLERDGARVMFMANEHVGEPRMTGTLYSRPPTC